MIANNYDGTLTANTASFQSATDFGLLNLELPVALDADQIAGRYFLARCGVHNSFDRAYNWGIYFRRPIFLAGYHQRPHQGQNHGSNEQRDQDEAASSSNAESSDTNLADAQFVIPYGPFIHTAAIEAHADRSGVGQLAADPGYAWLSSLEPDKPINLMGPFGNGFTLRSDCRNLLLIGIQGRIATLLPLIETMLNRGGRVTLLIRTSTVEETEALQAFLLPLLPIAVELHLAHNDKTWRDQLGTTLTWADQVCAALPPSELTGFTTAIRDRRFLLQEGFAQVLVDADLICGVGACLACVVSTANGGHTRACVNGPVFDLTRLSR